MGLLAPGARKQVRLFRQRLLKWLEASRINHTFECFYGLQVANRVLAQKLQRLRPLQSFLEQLAAICSRVRVAIERVDGVLVAI